MSREQFYTPSFWYHFSKKLKERISTLRYAGKFTSNDALIKGLRLCLGMEEHIKLYFLVDEADGIIADARFQIFGSAHLLGAADAAMELCIRKNYDQAQRMGLDLLDHYLRDKVDKPAFPKEVIPSIKPLFNAISQALFQCSDIPLSNNYHSPPSDVAIDSQPLPGWLELSKEEKIQKIEEVIEKEIRPYIELDAGGIEIVSISDQHELAIRYQGSCTTCYSATGSTLSAIQGILQARIHPELIVTPLI